MPLRMKCTTCAKELALDSAFRGASCRCYHCRNLVQVPLNGTASSSRVRPLFPPMAVIGATAAIRPASVTAATVHLPSASRFALNQAKVWAISSAAALLLIAGGIATWQYQTNKIAPPPTIPTAVPQVAKAVVPTEESAVVV